MSLTTTSRTLLITLTLCASSQVTALDPNCQLHAEEQAEKVVVTAACELSPADPSCELTEAKARREKQIEAIRANCELSDEK